MSDTPPAKPLEQLASRLVNQTQELAHREPVKAVAIAFGVGLALQLLPKRFLVSSVASAAVTMLRPALLTFGVVKAAELILAKNKPEGGHE